MAKKYPNLKEEKKLWQRGYKIAVGLDEAGRGPLAGPVVAAAVSILNTKCYMPDRRVRDSKQLSGKTRKALYKIITKDKNIGWGIGIVSNKIIDRINIKNAAELAMFKTVKNLKNRLVQKSDDRQISARMGKMFLLVDGNRLDNPKLKTIDHKLIVKGDEKVFSCAAASILAKVTRDRLMLKYHKKYPQYRFDLHKGYGTKLHFKLLKKYGPCVIHRFSFRPVLENVKRKAKSAK